METAYLDNVFAVYLPLFIGLLACAIVVLLVDIRRKNRRTCVAPGKQTLMDEPRPNTRLKYVTRSLDSAEEELKKLDIGLAHIQLSNYFITLRSVPEAEKASVVPRGEDLAMKLKKIAEPAIVARDECFPPA